MEKPSRLYLALLTEDWEVGHTDKRSPQHLTLVPPFIANIEPIEQVIEDVASVNQVFDVTVGQKDYFGPKGNIEVHLIEKNAKLINIHNQLLSGLGSKAVDLNYLKFIGEDYAPHITIKPAHEKVPNYGEVIKFDHIALLEKTRHERRLVAKGMLSNDKSSS